MLCRSRILGLTLAGLLVLPAALSAQQPIQLGLSTGVTAASAEANGAGFHVLAAAGARTPLPWTGVRLDGMYESARNVFSGSANLVLSPFQTRVSPYVIGGAGVFARSETPLVLNLGIGVSTRVLQQPLFFEARVYGDSGTFTTFSIGRSF